MEQDCYQNEEVRIIDYARILVRHKVFVLLFVMIATLGTFGACYVVPAKYEAKAVLVTADQTQSTMSTVSTIAAQFGISTGASTKATEVVGQLNALAVREAVVRKHQLIPVIVKERDRRGKTENQQMWLALKYLKDNLLATYDDKNQWIVITMDFRDPRVAKDILHFTVAEVTERMSTEAIRRRTLKKSFLPENLAHK